MAGAVACRKGNVVTRSRWTALVGAAVVAAVLAAPAVAQVDARDVVEVPELPVGTDGLARAIVAYDDGILPGGLLSRFGALGVVRGIELPSIGAVAVTAPQAVVEQLALDPAVVAVTGQRQLQLDLYASKEQINAVGVDQAEDYTATVDGAAGEVERPGVTGEGVAVAVLDSGIFADHPDFGGRVTTGLHFAFSEIQDTGGIAYEDWDAYVETTGVIALQDEIGHGTHVASTVGGDGSLSESNGGVDLAGVAPGVEFVSMKVADAPFGIVEDLDWEEAALAAFDYIIRHDELGIRIAQNSWGLLPTEPNCLGADCGEPTDFDAMQAMIAAVEDAGVSVVFSAGNDGPEPGTIRGYQSADHAILVGAACKSVDSTRCTGDQVVADFSSRGAADGSGPQVDVIAPGDTIMAAVSPSILLPLTECPESQELGYYCISGTSMAAPHVSGVVALMYDVNPDLTVDEVKDCLFSTAVDNPDVADLDEGHGMVDTRAALECAHTLTLDATDVAGDPPGSGTSKADPAPPGDTGPSRTLPATGGGVAILALLTLAGASGLRRR